MASKEPFLPVPTEEDAENPYAVPIPTAASYNAPSMTTNGSTFAPSVNMGGPSTASSMSFERGMMEEGNFPISSNYHTMCFGSCCDFRRAVLIVNGITIGIKLLVMMGVAIGVSYLSKNLDDIENDMDDDDNRKQLDEVFKSGAVAGYEALFEVWETITVGLHVAGIYGALMYKKWGIITASVTYAVALLFNLASGNAFDFIVNGLCLYPHVCMYLLMDKGIMTAHNYHKVASCCGDKHM